VWTFPPRRHGNSKPLEGFFKKTKAFLSLLSMRRNDEWAHKTSSESSCAEIPAEYLARGSFSSWRKCIYEVYTDLRCSSNLSDGVSSRKRSLKQSRLLEAEAEILKMLQHPIGNRMSQLHFARLASMDASSPQTRITVSACSLRTRPFGMLCEVITSLCTDNPQY
jgi:hypothetical protein